MGFRNMQEKLKIFFSVYTRNFQAIVGRNFVMLPEKKSCLFVSCLPSKIIDIRNQAFYGAHSCGHPHKPVFFNHFHVSPLKAVLLSPFFLLRQISAGTLSASCPNIGDSYGTVGQQGWPLMLAPFIVEVEMILEQRQIAFLSPSQICRNLNFSTEIQIQPLSVLKIFLLY